MEKAASIAGSANCQLVLELRMDELNRVAGWLTEASARLGFSEQVVFKLNLCIEEHFANLIMHEPEPKPESAVSFDLERDGTSTTLRIHDHCRPFDPTGVVTAQQPTSLEEAKIGGLGLQLIESFSDSSKYEANGAEGNVLTLRFD
jgi:anti-sigma regulatory factor (Ser/Thr protein kinase)